MSEILKPCPFCGGSNLKTGGDDKVVGVWCLTCQAAGPNHYGSREWNDRASSPTNLENAERADMTMTPHAYAQEYEFRGDTDYTPSDFERTVIEDAILGYLGEARIAERAEMEPKVKALDWEDDCGELFAKALFSDHYGISSFSKKEHLLTFPDEVRRGETFKSIEAAKAAAQSDYEARIRSCLLDKPEAGEADLRMAAQALISVYDEQSNVAQRIIVGGRSDRELREAGIAALADLRAALASDEGER